MKTKLVLLIFLFSTLSISAQNRPQVANPIFLGSVLIDDISEKSMVETCLYYQLTEIADEDGYKVFLSDDGTKVRFKIDETIKGGNPVVEVITKEKESNIKKILSKAGFHKTSEGYTRGTQYAKTVTRCIPLSANPKTLRFIKVSNQ